MPEALAYDRPRRKNTKAFNKFKQDLRSSFVKEQSIERARLAFRPSSACDPVSTISASLLNKDSGRAKPPPFNPDFPLDPALFEEEDQDQGESMAGQSTGEADNVDQEFEDELEPTAVLRHQPDHQRLIDALTAHCATSVLPVAESGESTQMQDAFFPQAIAVQPKSCPVPILSIQSPMRASSPDRNTVSTILERFQQKGSAARLRAAPTIHRT